jgi:hypothetical protein
MNRQHASAAAALFDPDHRVRHQPVVSVDYIEFARLVLDGKQPVDENPAHVVDVIDKVIVRMIGAAVILDTVDPVVKALTRRHPREYVYFMPHSLQARGQLGDM